MISKVCIQPLPQQYLMVLAVRNWYQVLYRISHGQLEIVNVHAYFNAFDFFTQRFMHPRNATVTAPRTSSDKLLQRRMKDRYHLNPFSSAF